MGRQTIAILLLLAICMAFMLVTCSFPVTAGGYDWSRTYGGHFQDNCFSLVNTSDGGFLIGGWTDSNLQNSSYSWFIENFFLLKTDKNGDQEWYRIYGNNYSRMGSYACEAPGGGYVLAGSLGEYLGENNADFIGLFKVDAGGRLVWEKRYRTGFKGWVKSFEAAPDGYILAGTDNCSVFLIKFDVDGNLAWDRSCDVSELDAGRALPTRDGGFVLAGGTFFDKAGKMFLMKTDTGGNATWLKYYGDGYTDGASVIEDRAGGFVIAGSRGTGSVGPFTIYKGYDVYVVRTDPDGNVLWEQTYDVSPDGGYANAIAQMDDGGYAVTGCAVRTQSGLYVIDSDAFLLRLDRNGTQQWVKKFGSPGEATGISVVTGDDGAIVLAGDRRNSDILLIKSPDAPYELTPLDEAIKSVEMLLYHRPYIFYCWMPLFLVMFISLSIALITIKRSMERKKKSQ